jgi:hypothetical protein
MKIKITLLLLFFITLKVISQEVPIVRFDSVKLNFKKVDKQTLRVIDTRSKVDKVIVIPIIQNEFKFLEKDSINKYSYDVKIDVSKTTLLSSDYKLTSSEVKVEKQKINHEVFLEIKKDSLIDRERKLVLYIEQRKNDSIIDLSESNHFNKLEFIIKPIENSLDNYEYLVYVGTNFDLVEGIKAKDLFFAGNILSKPNRFQKKSVGFYLSLYGNRAFTQVDSTGFFRTDTIYEQLTDTTYLKKTNRDTFLSKRVTDNIGAYISPLIQIKWLRTKNPKNNLLLYYSPSLEFVYRRTVLSREKLNSRTFNSETINGDFNDVSHFNNEQPSFSEVFNEYSFNAGLLALFMCLENEKISVRVHGSVGYTSNYYREFDPIGLGSKTKQLSDVFFSGRAWITEPKTGITLQAEVTNNMNNPRPFFVATLSKAFNFSKLGSLFQPIINK